MFRKTLRHPAIRLLSLLLSVLSVVALVVGWRMIWESLGAASPESCRRMKFLVLVAAPVLALTSLLTEVLGNDQGAKTGRRRFFVVVALAVLAGAWLTTLPPVMLPMIYCSLPSNEAVVTVGCLPELHSAITIHVSLHGRVPATLKELAVIEPSLGYSLLDPELAEGRKAGYEFTYTPGPPEADGARKRYTIVARPMEFGKTGTQNFFIDESGARRFTTENRPATAADCPVEEWQTCRP